jgi:GDPmannose 4,6-dehydratase
MINGQKNERIRTFSDLFPDVKLINGNLADFSSLMNVVEEAQPDEIYNLAALSFVGLSFEQPELTSNVTGLGPLRLLEVLRKQGIHQTTKFYQASSSEMFGKVQQVPQNETTAFYPRSPYGAAKAFAHHVCVNYREAYSMFICSGILFNHEGEFRGHEFVTRKITSNLAKIKLGKIDQFSLGSLEPKRDWGYAGDYVKAMWKMLQESTPQDFVIATGKTHSIKDFINICIEILDLPGKLKDYIILDPKMNRPSEVDLLIGDYSKAKRILGWEPKTDINQLAKLMIENDLNIEAQDK